MSRDSSVSVKSQYLALMKKYHPDKNQSESSLVLSKIITNAYGECHFTMISLIHQLSEKYEYNSEKVCEIVVEAFFGDKKNKKSNSSDSTESESYGSNIFSEKEPSGYSYDIPNINSRFSNYIFKFDLKIYEDLLTQAYQILAEENQRRANMSSEEKDREYTEEMRAERIIREKKYKKEGEHLRKMRSELFE